RRDRRALEPPARRGRTGLHPHRDHAPRPPRGGRRSRRPRGRTRFARGGLPVATGFGRRRERAGVIRVELAKQARRPRTLLTFGALAAFSVVLTVALAASGAGSLERVGDVPLLIAPARSGMSVPVIALSSTMKFFLPLAVAIFAGESVAGEAGWGSLRYAL